MIYTINNCIRAFGYTNFDNLIADMGSVDNLREYVRANGYADIAVAEDTELLLVDVNGKTWHTGCYGAVIEPPKPYLCFTSTGDSTVAMTQKGTPNTSAGKVIQYKLNDGQWQTWDLSAVTLADGDKMYLKSDDEIPMSDAIYTYKYFIMSGSISASGNIMSLLNFSDTTPNYCFNKLFDKCNALTHAPELQAINLNQRCYMRMFTGCTGITVAPELPATTLADYCYSEMFQGCTSLTQAPELPATTLASSCYPGMFQGCTSLTQAPELPATTLAPICYASMFKDCTSLTQAPELPTKSYVSDSCYGAMFSGCSSLTQAPALPATSLGEACYSQMFSGCTSLTQAPALPATMLNRECYAAMFSGCTSLVQAPELPAIKLEYRCYKQMFNGCTSLTTTPALPATTLVEECYNEMFQRCTSLVQAPALPATTLGSYCYSYMFNGCTVLTQAPALQATTLAQGCYSEMFMNCTSLAQAPELPAITLAPYCYIEMFSSCSNLNYVKAMFTDVPSEGNPVGSWLANVSSTGTFIKNSAATWTNEQAGIPTGWTVQVEGGVTPGPEPARDYLCFTSTGNSTVAMKQIGTPPTSDNKVIQYKLNNGQWQTWDLSAVTLADGDKMYLKSDDEIPTGSDNYYDIYKQFVMTGSIAASGNVMSLLNFSDTLPEHAFVKLFRNCTSLTTAPELPATTAKTSCYAMMFQGCTSLTQAPALPATTVYANCYFSMFLGCTSLTTAPELPATTLTGGCYQQMFYSCSNLNYVKAMFTDVQSENAVVSWLDDVSPTGTFVKNSAATWDNSLYIPSGWTVQTASPDK